MKYKCTIQTPLGEMIAAVQADSLCGLWFTGQKHFPADLSDWNEASEDPLCLEVSRQLKEYFSGNLKTFNIPLSPAGTDFQLQVWNLLRSIPFASTLTYGAASKLLPHGRQTSARALGGAVGRNPLSIIIPCHRVVGANGALTGYAGGVERKRALLALERQSADRHSGVNH